MPTKPLAPRKTQPGVEIDPDSKASQMQRLVSELSVEFISILDLDELIERVARRVKEVIDYKFFNLMLVDEAQGALVWKHSDPR